MREENGNSLNKWIKGRNIKWKLTENNGKSISKKYINGAYLRELESKLIKYYRKYEVNIVQPRSKLLLMK